MTELVLDTSTLFMYFAIIDKGQIVLEKRSHGFNNHSEMLIAELKESFESIDLKPTDIDKIYVGRGPGSYTGIRVAGTVAKTLAYTLGKPLFSFSSLDLLMSSAQADGLYVAQLDARRGFCYAKAVKIQNGLRRILLDDCYIAFAELYDKYAQGTFFGYEAPYDVRELLSTNCFREISDLHAFVPTYLRSGV